MATKTENAPAENKPKPRRAAPRKQAAPKSENSEPNRASGNASQERKSPAPRPAPKRESTSTGRADTQGNRASTRAAGATSKGDPLGLGASGGLLAAGALGMGLGVAAMVGRKLVVQAPTVFAGEWDQALAAEHAAVAKIFDALEATTNKDTGKRATLLAQLKHALAKHALQEENVIYPALRDAGEVEGADALNHDHGYVKQSLYELENCPKASDQFLAIVVRFRADIERHVRDEEDRLFPSLKSKLSSDINGKLTLMMNKEGFKLA